MHHTHSTEQPVWSSFDQFWAVSCGELLGDDVISWPCSFRGWNNTFRDLGALGLWTYLIGVAVPKSVYNKNKKEIQAFLGKIIFLWRFIPNYVEIVKDITDMLSKYHKVKWTFPARFAFDQIKKVIYEAPILANPNYFEPFSIFFLCL